MEDGHVSGMEARISDEREGMKKQPTTAFKKRTRSRQGKPSANPKYRPWTREEEALLGTATDPVIAARLGRQRATIAARRHKLGIKPAVFVPPNTWTAEEESLLGTA